MNKLKYIVLTIIISLFVIPYVKAESISIKSIELTEKSDTTTINSEPTFSGLEMNYDLTFKNMNDYAMYKIVIENNTNKEYKVTENTAFKVSEYVTYFYSSDKVINASSTTDIMITIKYTKQIDESLIPEEGETYKETNKAVLELKDENDEVVENPKTGVRYPVIGLIVILAVSSICMFIIKKKEVAFVLIGLLLIVPGVLYAIEELKLIINVNVEIQKPDPVTPPVVKEKHKVSYVISRADVFLTEEEMSKQDLTKLTCSDIYNVTKDSVTTTYKKCHGTYTYVDETEYEEGEKVSVKTLYLPYEITGCTVKEDGTYECIDEEFLMNELRGGTYYCSTDESDCSDKVAAMNITGDTYDYSDIGFIVFTENVTFDMPDNEVIIINSLSSAK